ncbi:hypothetical protein CAPTEDRAFT_199326 [Capitella teleta]|uniref:Uncharacterized protein n=1 Tax=Capitella teleta TaxID=283909 RepID=R7U0T3_CAPTE|nr:hypothetical protein CAPTEDRAFT_199326 [Capitella teleta]|eukprot:ELT97266.1 hypothetical protein CAPTEDRAFT_199326 [Capitella teleta]
MACVKWTSRWWLSFIWYCLWYIPDLLITMHKHLSGLKVKLCHVFSLLAAVLGFLFCSNLVSGLKAHNLLKSPQRNCSNVKEYHSGHQRKRLHTDLPSLKNLVDEAATNTGQSQWSGKPSGWSPLSESRNFTHFLDSELSYSFHMQERPTENFPYLLSSLNWRSSSQTCLFSL